MFSSLKTLAAAALLAGTLGMGTALAQAPNLDPVPASALTVVTKSTFEQEVRKADKPVIAIVVGSQSCTALEALLEQAAKDHPEAKFIKSEADEFGVPADKLPMLVSFAPGVSSHGLYEKANFSCDKASFDAIVKARIDAASKAMAAQKALEDASTQILETSPKLKALYDNYREQEDRAERIKLSGELSALFGKMAEKQREIIAIMDAERAAAK